MKRPPGTHKQTTQERHATLQCPSVTSRNGIFVQGLIRYSYRLMLLRQPRSAFSDSILLATCGSSLNAATEAEGETAVL